MRLLLTRPEPDNARTAAALRALGHDVVLAPMLRIEFVDNADLGPPAFAAVLLTSANGARAAARHPQLAQLQGLPVLAVGRGTAEAAREAGFGNVTSADGDADDLVRLAANRFADEPRPLLYLGGEDRSRDLAAALAPHGLTVRTVVVYRAVKADRLPAVADAALQKRTIDGVLHFSRRSAKAYLACSRHAREAALAPSHYCISAQAAEPLQQPGAGPIRVAAAPDEASLLALLAAVDMPKPRSNRLE